MIAAPYPPDTLAKGWRFEIDMEKVERSDTWLRAKTGAMRGALLLLWSRAWQQTPCGTLPDDDAPVHRVVPASEAPPLAWFMDLDTSMLLPSAASHAAEPENPDTPPKGAQAAQAPVKPSGRASTTPKDGAGPQGFRCALWSNGILEVRRETVGGAAELVLFSADEVRHLVRYLERMAESGA